VPILNIYDYLGREVFVKIKGYFVKGQVISLPNGRYYNVKIGLKNGKVVSRHSIDDTIYELN